MGFFGCELSGKEVSGQGLESCAMLSDALLPQARMRSQDL